MLGKPPQPVRLIRRQTLKFIEYPGLIDSAIQPEARRGFGIAGIPQDQLATANQDRYVANPNRELVQNSLNEGISIHVER